MDSGTGHIYEQSKVDIKSVKGKLVPWEVGEEVEVKECKFKVKEIRVFPEDEIVLVGKPNDMFSKLCDQSEDYSKIIKEDTDGQTMRDFIRKKK